MSPTIAPQKRDWTRIGLRLVAITMAYNVLEAGIALWFGASAESIALLGFGLDSAIECAAAGVLLWRLALEARGADAERLERAEQDPGPQWLHALPRLGTRAGDPAGRPATGRDPGSGGPESLSRR